MYCVKCGVALADTEAQCPLCKTRVFHPELSQPEATPLYPNNNPARKTIKRWTIMLILTVLFLLPISICLVSDLTLTGHVEWSGYVIGGLIVFYAVAMLPNWFEHPNPVIFTPIAFLAVACLLQYICWKSSGSWYFSFALPTTAALGVIVTTLVTLRQYIRRGRGYVYGGTIIALGAFCVLLEYLLHITFGLPGLFTWSLYPLVVMTLLGVSVLLIERITPIREALEKKFFL